MIIEDFYGKLLFERGDKVSINVPWVHWRHAHRWTATVSNLWVLLRPFNVGWVDSLDFGLQKFYTLTGKSRKESPSVLLLLKTNILKQIISTTADITTVSYICWILNLAFRFQKFSFFSHCPNKQHDQRKRVCNRGTHDIFWMAVCRMTHCCSISEADFSSYHMCWTQWLKLVNERKDLEAMPWSIIKIGQYDWCLISDNCLRR